jgi:hypothetical protein
MLLDGLAEGSLARLAAHIFVFLHIDHTGQVAYLISYPGDIHHLGDVPTTMA